MKNSKTMMLLAMMLMLNPMISNAQDADKPQSYWVHTDQVKPSKQAEYEKITKEFIEACKTHDLKGIDWSVARVDDGTYLTIAPIEKMGDFDNNPLAPLAEKMGEEKFREIFKNFDKCYDKHGDQVVVLDPELSYMPNGLTTNTEGQNYRKWHYLHVTPNNIEKLKEKMLEIKALYEKKGSKEFYRVYYNGFGGMGDYYLVVISAKDAQSYVKTSDENDVLLGEEGKKLMGEMYVLLEKYENKAGWMRPDLGYFAKK